MFDEWADAHFRPVRLIGTQARHLTREAQLHLFAQKQNERQRTVDKAVDAIRNRFGKASIHRGEE